MPRAVQQRRRSAIEYVEACADVPELIRVTTDLVTVARHPSGHGVVETAREPDLDLLIHTPSGQRIIRELPSGMLGRRRFEQNLPEHTDIYDELAEKADAHHRVDLKGTDQTLEIIADQQTRLTLAKGGARSMKTHTGSQWSFRQWMLRGTPGGLGWFIGPEMAVAHVLKDKWCVGEDNAPPVCPPELILDFPQDVYSTDQHIYMVDGFRIRLVHTKADGRNMPGRSITFWQWTEGAVTNATKSFVRARGRIVTSKGQGLMDAVPEPRNYLRRALEEPAEEEAAEEAEAFNRGEPYTRSIRVHTLQSKDNPWNDEEDTTAFFRDLERIDPRLAAREAGGESIGDTNLVFDDVFDAAAHTFDYEGFFIPAPVDHCLLQGRPLVDVTRQVSLRWFMREHDWLAAVDVNANPHTTIVAKYATAPGLDASNPNNLVAVVFDEFQVWNVDSYEAADKLAERYEGRYKGAGVIMDASSCNERHNAGGSLNKGWMPREAYQARGFEVKPPDYWESRERKPKNPRRFDATILQRRMFRENRILIERTRCKGLVRAIREQDAEPDGLTPAKHSNTNHDRKISSRIETKRYLVWPFCAVEERRLGTILARKHA